MTPTEFRARLRALGLTKDQFADLTDTHETTVRMWGKVRNRSPAPFPAWVSLLLSAWERGPVALRKAVGD